jgi:non-reducing end alpha-L-arabinofuranosidase
MNHLRRAPAGQQRETPDNEAIANALELTIAGHPVYGIHSTPGTGYRNDVTSGVATGDEPGTIYEVASSAYFNNSCCYDYGNAETDNHADGRATMEAVYFGNWKAQGKGAGNGPWVMADMENGLYAGPSFAETPTTRRSPRCMSPAW